MKRFLKWIGSHDPGRTAFFFGAGSMVPYAFLVFFDIARPFNHGIAILASSLMAVGLYLKPPQRVSIRFQAGELVELEEEPEQPTVQ